MKGLDIRHVASEESQKDWNRAEYQNIYREAFIDGADYVKEQLIAPTDNGIEKLDRLCKQFNDGEICITALVCSIWNEAIITDIDKQVG